jgi:prepilin-type N-terminal cleavage/methylation domain-containing protein
MIQSRNYKKGFTLIELMLVIGVVTLMLGISVYGLINLIQWNQLNRSAILLSSQLKDAQSEAFYSGEYYKINFMESLDRYRIYKQTELVEEIILKNIDLFNTNFSDDRVYFYPSGVPGQGGTVTLKNSLGKVLYVIMTPVTARVRVSREPPENW